MRKIFTSISLFVLGVAASAGAVSAPGIETLESPFMSPESPETSLTATKAQFTYYSDYYKNGTNCYQLVMTNCTSGFSGGGRGTLPAGPGQLLCVFLCGPASESSSDPVLPTGTYTFSETPATNTFSKSYSHWVDAFLDSDNQLTGWQLSPEGGTITITKENGIYTVNASVKVANGDTTLECTATYTGEIGQPAPIPGLPSSDYQLTIPNLSGMYDSSQGVFSLSFYGCALDDNGYVVGRGDLTNLMIIYRGDGDLLEALEGEHTHVPYMEYQNYQNGNYLGGYLYKITSDFALPMGTYNAVYNEYGSIESCGLAAGGIVTVSHEGDLKDGNLTFDFDLITEQGGTMKGSWSGNIYGKILGIEPPAGIDKNIVDEEPIIGLSGQIIAPENAEVYTTSGVLTGRDNLQPGIYIVRCQDVVKKVLVK